MTENACMSKTKVRIASSEALQQKEQGTSNNSKDDLVSETLSNALSQTTHPVESLQGKVSRMGMLAEIPILAVIIRYQSDTCKIS